MQSESKDHVRAWMVVGLLWFVGVLNYLDRNMITTMGESLQKDISMTQAEFGLLTSVFLWVYGIFNPIAGFLSDKVSRSRVIIVSVFVWSAVTWLTAYSTNYNELRLARALMGISEACFIPAALALTADYHRGATRSLANGLVLSGVCFGGAIGGVGGWMAERSSWTTPFKVFGVVGVIYAVILILLLRDAPSDRETTQTTDKPTTNFRDAVRSLFAERRFLLIIGVWSLLGFAGWLLSHWMPTYLQETFTLKQGDAGLLATLSLQGLATVGVILGGYWGDRWSAKSTRGLILVPAIGLVIAAAGVFVTANSGVLAVVAAGMMFYGLARVFTDANLMPILCQICDSRYRATGYGVLNAFSCAAGGLAAYAGGVVRDHHGQLRTMFQFGAASLVLCAMIILQVRVSNHVSREKQSPETP